MKKKTDARANAPSPPLELSSSNPSPILLFSPHVSPKKTPLVPRFEQNFGGLYFLPI
jgi:hypothetical protein